MEVQLERGSRLDKLVHHERLRRVRCGTHLPSDNGSRDLRDLEGSEDRLHGLIFGSNKGMHGSEGCVPEVWTCGLSQTDYEQACHALHVGQPRCPPNINAPRSARANEFGVGNDPLLTRIRRGRGPSGR